MFWSCDVYQLQTPLLLTSNHVNFNSLGIRYFLHFVNKSLCFKQIFVREFIFARLDRGYNFLVDYINMLFRKFENAFISNVFATVCQFHIRFSRTFTLSLGKTLSLKMKWKTKKAKSYMFTRETLTILVNDILNTCCHQYIFLVSNLLIPNQQTFFHFNKRTNQF